VETGDAPAPTVDAEELGREGVGPAAAGVAGVPLLGWVPAERVEPERLDADRIAAADPVEAPTSKDLRIGVIADAPAPPGNCVVPGTGRALMSEPGRMPVGSPAGVDPSPAATADASTPGAAAGPAAPILRLGPAKERSTTGPEGRGRPHRRDENHRGTNDATGRSSPDAEKLGWSTAAVPGAVGADPAGGDPVIAGPEDDARAVVAEAAPGEIEETAFVGPMLG